jgi:hypothetical protein
MKTIYKAIGQEIAGKFLVAIVSANLGWNGDMSVGVVLKEGTKKLLVGLERGGLMNTSNMSVEVMLAMFDAPKVSGGFIVVYADGATQLIITRDDE